MGGVGGGGGAGGAMGTDFRLGGPRGGHRKKNHITFIVHNQKSNGEGGGGGAIWAHDVNRGTCPLGAPLVMPLPFKLFYPASVWCCLN